MALTAVISAVLFSTYSLVVNNGRAAREEVLRRESERVFFSVLDNDIATLYQSGDDEEKTLPRISRKAIVPSKEWYKERGQEQPLSEDEVLLSFAAGNRLASNEWQENNQKIDQESSQENTREKINGPVCVEYVLRLGRQGKAFIRRERSYCGVEGSFPWTEFVLRHKLRSVKIEMYRQGSGWRTDWDVQSQNKIPFHAIRFTFFEEGNDEESVFISPILSRRLDLPLDKRN